TTSGSSRVSARRTSCGWRAHEHPPATGARRGGRGRSGTDPPVVRGGAAVVQDRCLLRDPHPRLLRRQRRRLGRPPLSHGEARLPPVAPGRPRGAAAVLQTPPARPRPPPPGPPRRPTRL